MRGSAVAASSLGATTIALARVAPSFAFNFLSEKKLIWPEAARSSGPTRRISTCASPATRPPRRETICPSVKGPGIPSFRRQFAFERLDHPVGDVDARARVHGVLEDDVEELLLGALPDHAGG